MEVGGEYKEEIGKCTYREFTTGFFFGKPGADEQIYGNSTYVKNYIYLGTAQEADAEGRTVFEQKNKFLRGDRIEIMNLIRFKEQMKAQRAK